MSVQLVFYFLKNSPLSPLDLSSRRVAAAVQTTCSRKMHFWIDKRSPYGFGRGARVSGSGFGQYPRRMRPTKPWSQNNRSGNAATTPTSADRNSYPLNADTHHHHNQHGVTTEPSDGSSSRSYFKWSLWTIAIALCTLVYIICAKLYHEHQLFTFCALLALFFIFGVCTISSMFRRTTDAATAGPQVVFASPAVVRQESTSSSSRNSQGGAVGHPQPPQGHHSNNTLDHSNYATVNRSPSISIHNLAESPTPTYHNSHNQV